MPGQPFFSVIIPTYNRAHLLGSAIESMLGQSYQDWELLIVDDGSIDDTKEVVASYKDDRIIYIYQKNAERSAARNNGIANAKGKYICFLDSDDYFTPARLQKLYERVTKGSGDFYYTDLQLETSANTAVVYKNPDSAYNISENFLLSPIHSQQVCIKKEVFEKYKFDPAFRIGEDTELWLRIVKEYTPVYLPDCADVIIIDHDDRSVNVKRYNSALEFLNTLKKILSREHSGEIISEPVKSKVMSTCHFNIAKYYIHQDMRGKALKHMVYSIADDLTGMQSKYKMNILINILINPSKAQELVLN